MPAIENYDALRAKALARISAKRRVAEGAASAKPADGDDWLSFASVEEAVAFLREAAPPPHALR